MPDPQQECKHDDKLEEQDDGIGLFHALRLKRW